MPARGRRGLPRASAAFTVEAVERARAGHRPRRRRLRRRRRRLGRRARPLDPLRADLLRRARHGAGAAAARGGRDRRSPARAPTATRWSSGRWSTATRSASAAPTASTPSRRPSACGWPASPSRPTATSPGSSDAFEQLAVGKLSGAVGTYASVPPAVEARVMERLGLRARGRRDPGRPARPPRGPDLARSRSPAAASSASRPRSATCSGPRCARSRSRSAPARRAPRRCRTSATRSAPSGSPASPACCAATPRPGSRTSPSGTSATSPTPAPSG